MRYSKLSLGAQTAYAELFDQAQTLEMQHHLGRLAGSFHKKKLKGREYWYFALRDVDGGMRFAYVGPDNERVASLIARFRSEKAVSLEARACHGGARRRGRRPAPSAGA